MGQSAMDMKTERDWGRDGKVEYLFDQSVYCI